MLYQLAPVGNAVSLDTSKKLADVSVFSTYQIQYYASGTAALAAALVASLDASLTTTPLTTAQGTEAKTKKRAQPEIILPAYGCPDLISAAVYAGVKPILVDLEADSPWLDLQLVVAAITENTIAIVAVDLFGIPERWTQLREISDQFKLVLIEDSAQYFPGVEDDYCWQGDLVVLSFGRGKPVSLLGGGAVLTRKNSLYKCLPKPETKPSSWIKQIKFGLKTRLYNVMISPLLYWLPQTLPFLHLGETHYHPLQSIEPMDQSCLNVLASNISRYQCDVEAMSRCQKISDMLESSGNVKNLPLINDIEVKTRLLRYPLLVEEPSRDGLYETLKQAGLGASVMYPAALPKIAGLEHILDNTVFENAEKFAARIITLPTHRYVSNNVIAKMKTVFKKLSR